MHRIKPNNPSARDALSGEILPKNGVLRQVLLPPDHYAQRQGDITITEEKPAEAAPAVDSAAGAASASKVTRK